MPPLQGTGYVQMDEGLITVVFDKKLRMKVLFAFSFGVF
jgi:hypothetical protein